MQVPASPLHQGASPPFVSGYKLSLVAATTADRYHKLKAEFRGRWYTAQLPALAGIAAVKVLQNQYHIYIFIMAL